MKPSEDVAMSLYTQKVELLPGIEPPVEEYTLKDWTVTLPESLAYKPVLGRPVCESNYD
jgi:hypothetical protein